MRQPHTKERRAQPQPHRHDGRTTHSAEEEAARVDELSHRASAAVRLV